VCHFKGSFNYNSSKIENYVAQLGFFFVNKETINILHVSKMIFYFVSSFKLAATVIRRKNEYEKNIQDILTHNAQPPINKSI